jgi:hypothetical protein
LLPWGIRYLNFYGVEATMSSKPIMSIDEINAMLREQAELRAEDNYEWRILLRAVDYIRREVNAPYFKTMSFPGPLTREEVREKFRAEKIYEKGRYFPGSAKADRLTFDNWLFPSAYEAEVYLAKHCPKDGFVNQGDALGVRYKETDGGESWLIGAWW